MIVREESVSMIRGEIEPLIEAHYEEVNGEDPLVINTQMALELEAAGALLLMVMRDDDHQICGYTFNLIRKHHKHDFLMADCRAIYVKKGCRGFVSFQLERETEEGLRARGVHKSYISSRLKMDIGPFISAVGYKPAVMTYEKVL